MASALASLKTTYTKTKQKLLSKGAQDDSNDVLYQQEKERIIKLEEVMARINKHSANSLRILQDLGRLQNDIASDIHSLYEPSDRGFTTTAALQTASQASKEGATKMVVYGMLRSDEFRFCDLVYCVVLVLMKTQADGLSTNFVKPSETFCVQFKEIRKRMEDFSNRRNEMERNLADVNKLREKASSANKLPQAEEKYRISQQTYENMRQDLMRDLPALYNERVPFFDHIFAFLIKIHLEYYAECSREFEHAVAATTNINESDVLSHAKVITPTDRSFVNKNVRSDPVFSAHKGRPLPQPSSDTTTPVPSASVPQNQPQAAPAPVPIQASAVIAPTASATPTSKAKALHTFNGEEDVELSFQKGDILTIYSKEGDWWEGEINGVRGLLPSNYVQLI